MNGPAPLRAWKVACAVRTCSLAMNRVGRGVPAEPATAPRTCRSCAGSPETVRPTGPECSRGSWESPLFLSDLFIGHEPGGDGPRPSPGAAVPHGTARARFCRAWRVHACCGRGRPRSGSWDAFAAFPSAQRRRQDVRGPRSRAECSPARSLRATLRKTAILRQKRPAISLGGKNARFLNCRGVTTTEAWRSFQSNHRGSPDMRKSS